MKLRLEGEVAVVIGGTRGIGAAIVRRFSEQGCRVVFCGRTVELGQQLERECAENGWAPVAFKAADLNNPEDIKAVVDEAVDRFGKISVLVNNAAATGVISSMGATADITLEAWNDYMLQGLSIAVFLPVKYAVPHLIKAGGGSIVNICSAAATRGLVAAPPYVAVKGAEASLTRTWAVEFYPHKIRCNALTLGMVDTGTPTMEGIKANPELFEIISGMQLLGMGTPDDVAFAALWLASPESRWVTGTVIPVDGGATCYLPQLKIADPRIRKMRQAIKG